MLSDPKRLAANDPGLIYDAWRSLQTGRDEGRDEPGLIEAVPYALPASQ